MLIRAPTLGYNGEPESMIEADISPYAPTPTTPAPAAPIYAYTPPVQTTAPAPAPLSTSSYATSESEFEKRLIGLTPAEKDFWRDLKEKGAYATGDPMQPYVVPPPDTTPKIYIEVSPQISPVFTQVQDSPGATTAVTTAQLRDIETERAETAAVQQAIADPAAPFVPPQPLPLYKYGDLPGIPTKLTLAPPPSVPGAFPVAQVAPAALPLGIEPNWLLIGGAVLLVGGAALLFMRGRK